MNRSRAYSLGIRKIWLLSVLTGVSLVCIPSLLLGGDMQRWQVGERSGVADQVLTAGGDVLSIGGRRVDGVDSHIVTLRDRSGQEIWGREFLIDGHMYFSGLGTDLSGNIWIAGGIQFDGSGDEDFLAVKLAPNGDLLWAKTLGAPAVDQAYDLAVGADGGALLVGFSPSPELAPDISIVKLADDGSIEWDIVHGTYWALDHGVTATALANGDYLVGGSMSPAPASSDRDAWLARLQPNGEIVWQRGINAPNIATTSDAIELPNGDLVAGILDTDLDAEEGRYLLVRLDGDGNLITHRAYGVPGVREHWMRIAAVEDGLLVAGSHRRADGPSEKMEGWLMKTDEFGDAIWQKTYQTALEETQILQLLPTGAEVLLSGSSWNGDVFNREQWSAWTATLDFEGNVGPGCDLIRAGTAIASELQLSLRQTEPRVHRNIFVARDVELDILPFTNQTVFDCVGQSLMASLELSPDGCGAPLDLTENTTVVAGVIDRAREHPLSISADSVNLEGVAADVCFPRVFMGEPSHQSGPCGESGLGSMFDLFCVFPTEDVRMQLCRRGVEGGETAPAYVQMWGSTDEDEAFLISDKIVLEDLRCDELSLDDPSGPRYILHR